MGGSKRPATSSTPTPTTGDSNAGREAKRINKSANLLRPKAAAPRGRVVPFCTRAIESEIQGDQARQEQSTSADTINQIVKMASD